MNRFPVQLHRMEPELVIMRIAVIRKPVIPRPLVNQAIRPRPAYQIMEPHGMIVADLMTAIKPHQTNRTVVGQRSST